MLPKQYITVLEEERVWEREEGEMVTSLWSGQCDRRDTMLTKSTKTKIGRIDRFACHIKVKALSLSLFHTLYLFLSLLFHLSGCVCFFLSPLSVHQ